MLDEAGAPYTVHYAVGERASLIAEVAEELRCDHIVMGTARKSSLVRTFEDSVTSKVLELTTVPVVVIPGEPASRAERYGIPAGVGAGLALLVAAAAE
jgi:nucleotide-binding universal stress UspA family protein